MNMKILLINKKFSDTETCLMKVSVCLISNCSSTFALEGRN
ncbi:MAG: hypothetical protein AABW89_00925 [Nanoarchaeota archaeon]